MKFIADFHIHSRFSRATSKSLNFEELWRWAKIKGLSVVGTGDCTHPQWLSEAKEKLEYCGDGLFKLKKEYQPKNDFRLPEHDVRFMFTGEISTIYKAGDKTRKVHHVVCLPDYDAAIGFASRLERIGNIHSDGRPILGLDSRDLLETLLEVSSDSVLIPAHIWTPWFSVLGSKSGFDSIEECYRDLSPHIFALETGLSSDPAMNWMVSSLDRYTLVSNSDAHSANKLGREANLFDCELSYNAIMNSLREPSKGGFKGTLEFFPQEGKYHFDGHRNCNICFDPVQSRESKGLCPKCGKPLTLGVMYRVAELADRKFGEKPKSALEFESVLSLSNILSEVMQVGPTSKRVVNEYNRLIGELGAELDILRNTSLEEIEKKGSPLLAEAIKRVRNGNVTTRSGYDGEFGAITVFDPEERKKLKGQHMLFVVDQENVELVKKPLEFVKRAIEFNDDQLDAITYLGNQLVVVGEQGTGKTQVLIERIIWLVIEEKVDPVKILVIASSKEDVKLITEKVEESLNRMGHASSVKVITLDQIDELSSSYQWIFIDIEKELEVSQVSSLKELIKEKKSFFAINDLDYIKTFDKELIGAHRVSLKRSYSQVSLDFAETKGDQLSFF